MNEGRRRGSMCQGVDGDDGLVGTVRPMKGVMEASQEQGRVIRALERHPRKVPPSNHTPSLRLTSSCDGSGYFYGPSSGNTPTVRCYARLRQGVREMNWSRGASGERVEYVADCTLRAGSRSTACTHVTRYSYL